MATSGFEKVIIRPIDKELAYALLYDIVTLASNMKGLVVAGRGPAANEVSVIWSDRGLFGGGARVTLRIRSEVKTDDSLAMLFESDVFKARIEYRLVPVFYALHITVRASCEGGNLALCSRFLDSFVKGLEEALKKPIQPMIKPPKPAPQAAKPVEAVVKPPEAPKPAAPPAPQPPPPPRQVQPEKPAPQEKEAVDVTKLFDEVSVAMMLLNSDLVAAGEMTPPWEINNLLSKAREKKGVLSQYRMGMISVKDRDETTDLVIFVNRNGDPLGFFGKLEGNIVKGLSNDIASVEKTLTSKEVSYRIWGVKQLVVS